MKKIEDEKCPLVKWRFKKGYIPWNKGKRGYKIKKSNEKKKI